ncbi:sialin-like [Chironomus tepperi]|uniref:sialin-like n=1 Tax=Chironomus tepperi TaxID=113505 RepID=UPI00391F501C
MTENRTIQNADGSVSYEKDFDWNSQEKGFALGAFFYGYISTHFIGGVLATKYGGHLIFNFGIFGTALFTMITPFMAHFGIEYLIAVRVVVGIFSGFSYTSANDVLSRWVPPSERSRSAGYTLAGVNVGTFTANLASGYISVSLGWEWIFYTFGIAALIWSVLWLMIVHRSPETDPWISVAERKFIANSQGGHSIEKVVIKTPWKAIFTSLPLWAIIVAHTSYMWGYTTLVTQLPSYLDEVLHFNLKDSALLSSLPYMVYTVLVFIAGFLADWIFKRKFLSVTQIRKYFNNISFLCQMAFLLVAAFNTDKTIIIVCIVLSVGLGAFSSCGYTANVLDIAPQFSSLIFGISCTIATLPGMVSPPLSGYIATTPSAGEYQIIFLITCGIYLFGAIFYGLFASGEIQYWAITESSKKPSSGSE